PPACSSASTASSWRACWPTSSAISARGTSCLRPWPRPRCIRRGPADSWPDRSCAERWMPAGSWSPTWARPASRGIRRASPPPWTGWGRRARRWRPLPQPWPTSGSQHRRPRAMTSTHASRSAPRRSGSFDPDDEPDVALASAHAPRRGGPGRGLGSLVGPVRSLRSPDPPVVTPIGGLFAYSGGIGPFIALLHQAPVVDVGVNAFDAAYYRRPGRPAPHNLYSSTPRLRQRTPAGAKPPPPLFTYLGPGESFAPAGVGTVTHLDMSFGPLTSATWDWDPQAGVWRRGTNGTPHTVESGAQLGFTNVILQYVPYRNTGQVDPVREPVDEAVVVGSGDAIILSQGKVVKGTWTKGSAGDVTRYTD